MSNWYLVMLLFGVALVVGCADDTQTTCADRHHEVCWGQVSESWSLDCEYEHWRLCIREGATPSDA